MVRACIGSHVTIPATLSLLRIPYSPCPHRQLALIAQKQGFSLLQNQARSCLTPEQPPWAQCPTTPGHLFGRLGVVCQPFHRHNAALQVGPTPHGPLQCLCHLGWEDTLALLRPHPGLHPPVKVGGEGEKGPRKGTVRGCGSKEETGLRTIAPLSQNPTFPLVLASCCGGGRARENIWAPRSTQAHWLHSESFPGGAGPPLIPTPCPLFHSVYHSTLPEMPKAHCGPGTAS